MGYARTVALSGADQAVLTAAGIYRGFALRETSGGASATVRLHDGTSAAGTLIDSIQLAAGESRSEWLDGGGLWVERGIFLDVVSGAVEGSLRVG